MEIEKDRFDVDEYSQNALSRVMTSIKKSNELPTAGDDYDYYNSFSGFRKIMNVESKKTTSLMEKILNQQGIKLKLVKMDLEEMFDAIVEANDMILERVGNSIDEVNGLRKKEDEVVLTTVATKLDINTSWNKNVESNKRQAKNMMFRLLAGRNILRPQLKFKEKVDNRRSPFVPIIKEKPNSIKPLSVIFESTDYGEMYSHPYQCELNHFKVGEEHLKKADLQKPKPVQETPFHFIDSIDKLQELNSVLKAQKEFAVDLEHHSYRTFLGITCLMQISTRDADYIVDPLELRSELQILNESFTDPKIVKVFHGADSDVEWLQRDFGLYVVNMFDTGQASKLLNFAHFSLGFLLKHYCGIDANKQYQLADWRIRPLPKQMVHYAREDTHYLLYIYDNMKNELLEKANGQDNLLLSVFQRSKVICEKRYIKPIFHYESYMDLYRKSRKLFNTRQLHALREIYNWRDEIARAEDESTGYVLPNHMLLQISEVLPRDQQGIFACCNPIPPFVRQYLNEIHSIVFKSREQPLIKSMEQEIQIEVDVRRHDVDLDNVLHCPHDFSHLKESYGTDTGPTILDMWNKEGENFENRFSRKKNNEKNSADLAALISLDDSDSKSRKKCANIESSFKCYCGPFQRYSLVRPMLKKADQTKAKEGKTINDAVNEVKDHFIQLAAVHGIGEQAEKMEAVASPAAGGTTSDVKDPDEKSTQSKEIEKKGSIREKFMMGKKSKNAKRKRKLESEMSTETPSETNKVKSEDKKEVGEEEKPKTKKKKKGNKNKKKGAQAESKLKEEKDFEPFDYNKANFKEFKGGIKSQKKKKKQFNPIGQFAQKFKGSLKPKQGRASQNKSLTYTVNTDNLGNAAKVSWPK